MEDETAAVLDRWATGWPQYAREAFVFAALVTPIANARVRRVGHVSGAEFADSFCYLARQQFGLLAPAILAAWGIRSSLDIGHIVMGLVDTKFLSAQPEDRLESFDQAVDFAQAFDPATYEWSIKWGDPHRGPDLLSSGLG